MRSEIFIGVNARVFFFYTVCTFCFIVVLKLITPVINLDGPPAQMF